MAALREDITWERFLSRAEVVPSRMTARGSGSEIALSARVTWVWTLDEEGLAFKVEAFDSLAAALEAVGLQS